MGDATAPRLGSWKGPCALKVSLFQSLPVICLNSKKKRKNWAISYSLQLPDSGQSLL